MVIVDTSVAIKWYFDEEGSEEARALLREEELGAPDLLYYEFSNFLTTKNFITEEEAAHFLDQLYKLPLQAFFLPQNGFKRAVRLAKKLGLSLYDASFVTLAESLKTPFITADRKLFHKTRPLRFVKLLGEE